MIEEVAFCAVFNCAVYLFDSCKFGPELCAADVESDESQITSKRGQMAANAEAVLTGHTAQG